MDGKSYGFDSPDFAAAPSGGDGGSGGADFAPTPAAVDFAPGSKTGPEANFRDGSGDRDEEMPPF
jgi:hypothetical protein